ncbi:hypothetical protein ONZ45_g4581 [Pleurotus djamor]|nr:hypothetical protein ONZ45_g4581 [Pleurotus djamor]
MSSQPLGRLQHIPWEVIKSVLQFAQLPDLLALTHSCRYFRDLASSDIALQYIIEAHFAGAHVLASEFLGDGGHGRLATETSLKDKLELLRRRENAWATLQPNTRETIDLTFRHGNLHGLRSGVLELGRAPEDSFLHTNHPPASSLKYALLSEGQQRFAWKDWIPEDEYGRICGTCVAFHESDLLVVVTTADESMVDFTSQSVVHFVQLTTGLPHPQAPTPHLETIAHRGAAFVSSSVLVVLNWMTGTITLNHPFQGPRSGLHFISLTTLLLGRPDALEIWDIKPVPRHIGSLSFPLVVQDGFSPDRDCAFTVVHIHGEPSPLQAMQSHHSVPSPTVRDDPEKTLITFAVIVKGSTFIFVSRRNGLLVAAESLRVVQTADGEQRPTLSYSEWAPNIVRWIPAADLNIQWSMRHHGQRMVLSPPPSSFRNVPFILYDFNLYHVKKWTSKMSQDPSTEWTVPLPFWWKTPSFLPRSPRVVYSSAAGLPFAEEVPEMPYVCYQSEEHFHYGGVWMDGEHVVGLKYSGHLLTSVDILHFGGN